MKRYNAWLLLCAAAFALLLAACGDDDSDSSTPTATGTAATSGPFFDCATQHPSTTPDSSSFPVTVTDSGGTEVTIDAPPAFIASLDAAHTEVLYAIGAGSQVKAVDNTSNCPAQVAALEARIDAFNPSVEAVTAMQPDLVVTAFDTGDLVASLRSAGITVLFLEAPADVAGTYDDIQLLGRATGHTDEADTLVTAMSNEVSALAATASGEQPTVYHELDNTYYSVGPGSFLDDMYKTLGATNIAESTGQAYPQLSAEAIIAANPDVIILADEGFGENATTVAARPGWSAINAVKNDRIYAIDPDIVSRPGPRIVDAMRQLAAALYSEAGG
jgi:iron complex transport system substrate-binding protein